MDSISRFDTPARAAAVRHRDTDDATSPAIPRASCVDSLKYAATLGAVRRCGSILSIDRRREYPRPDLDRHGVHVVGR